MNFNEMYALLYFVIFCVLVGCGNDGMKQDSEAQRLPLRSTFFGKRINEKGAVLAIALKEKLGDKDSMHIKVQGKVVEVCQKKGCWMNLALGEEEMIQVTFKDYSYFVPKDASGKIAILEGVVKKELISVEALRHYAEDAGKSKIEINKIINPEFKIVFIAEGVILK